jgi:surface polysaccharide O-acyltransferase-like enzyme
MEISKRDMSILKGVAILFMLLLHLFCRKEVNGLYEIFPTVHGIPLVYYIGLFGDACVPIFCFASGYGLFVSFNNEPKTIMKKNLARILKLLIKYWIILVLFVTVGYLAGKTDLYPGNPINFLLNFFVLSDSYNSAWWFLQTYIILVLLAPLLLKITKKYNSNVLLIISGIIYFVSYIQRIKHVFGFDGNIFLNAIVYSIVLAGTSQLPFIIGSIFAKETIYSKLYNKFHNLPFKNTICLSGILVLAILHARYETLFIAPFTAIAFICLFNLMKKSNLLQKALAFLGNHSTNMWLTHMFFYMTIFPSLVFAPKYPIFIFAWLIMLCLFSSLVINLIYKPFIQLVDKKTSTINKREMAIHH